MFEVKIPEIDLIDVAFTASTLDIKLTKTPDTVAIIL
jgi:hypothetical protein